ncbi:uncharacterized protein DEA37_0004255 [Paragonimus westermani]|uniref:Uncharacterized protein n=1 Tax=Paragonimus westermani TaxID=34504 RepID=A0A5J4NSN1_9TREM|nr:uncharacterized protein DEA37_0004255 [Paragonimus westermani]
MYQDTRITFVLVAIAEEVCSVYNGVLVQSYARSCYLLQVADCALIWMDTSGRSTEAASISHAEETIRRIVEWQNVIMRHLHSRDLLNPVQLFSLADFLGQLASWCQRLSETCVELCVFCRNNNAPYELYTTHKCFTRPVGRQFLKADCLLILLNCGSLLSSGDNLPDSPDIRNAKESKIASDVSLARSLGSSPALSAVAQVLAGTYINTQVWFIQRSKVFRLCLRSLLQWLLLLLRIKR